MSVILSPSAGYADYPGSAGISSAAYALLMNRVFANRASWYVYQDQDSGFNHGFPSGFFGTISKIHLNAGCVDDPNSPTGCSSNGNVLDMARGTILSLTFDPLAGAEFAGVNFEEPENYGANVRGIGYDLRGATRIVFEVRTPTVGGVDVRFGVAGHNTDFIHIPQSSAYTTLSFPLASLGLTDTDLMNTHLLFTVVTNAANAPNGAIVLLDNIRFDPVPSSQQNALSFPLGTQTFGVIPSATAPFPPDQVLRQVTTTYESAMTLLTLLSRNTAQDRDAARLVANAFHYALHHDNHGDPLPLSPDGSTGLHNAYSSGDIFLQNSQGTGSGQIGDVRLTGFTPAPPTSGFYLVLDGATGGNNAFAMLALIAAYRQFGDASYLNDAVTIGNWIYGNLLDTTGTGFGGYYTGYPDAGVTPKTLEVGKSTENNADIFAAFTALAAIRKVQGNGADAAEWTRRANIAGDFVMTMFDAGAGRFYAGTAAPGTTGAGFLLNGPQQGQDVVNTFDFLDSDSFTTLAMAAAPRYQNQIDWRRPVQYIQNNFAQSVQAGGQQFSGYDIVQTPISGANGVAWEFTGQTVSVMRFVDRLYGDTQFEGAADATLAQIHNAQTGAPFGDGQGLVASTLQGGDSLTPLQQALATPFQNIPERVGLAATTWGALADQSANPLLGLPVPLTRWFEPYGPHLLTSSPAEQNSLPALNWVNEGSIGQVYVTADDAPNLSPLYRLYHPYTQDHFYTLSAAERAAAVGAGYQLENVSGYVFANAAAGRKPLYRLFNAFTGEHLFTAEAGEYNGLPFPWQQEGVAAYILPAPPRLLYRLFNPFTGLHFLSTDAAEQSILVQNGWLLETDEGAVLANASDALDAIPFYRLFNPYTGDHLYTDSAAERDAAVQTGYQFENVSGYVFAQAAAGRKPLYRLFNPFTGEHLFTSEAGEYNGLPAPWIQEGIAAYLY